MANILFSKKFLAKLTSIIRIFWWQGVQKEQQKKAHPLQIIEDNLQTKKGRRFGNQEVGVSKQRFYKFSGMFGRIKQFSRE